MKKTGTIEALNVSPKGFYKGFLSKGKDRASSLYMSACIVAAQFVMFPVALLTGKLAAERLGSSPQRRFWTGPRLVTGRLRGQRTREQQH